MHADAYWRYLRSYSGMEEALEEITGETPSAIQHLAWLRAAPGSDRETLLKLALWWRSESPHTEGVLGERLYRFHRVQNGTLSVERVD